MTVITVPAGIARCLLSRGRSRQAARMLIALNVGCLVAVSVPERTSAWEHWGGDAGGTRFSRFG